MSFRAPPSLREATIEWPPGSGKTATYREYERVIVRSLAGRIPPHIEHCPGHEHFDPARRNLEGCPACAAWNEIDWIHGLKVRFDATILHESVSLDA